jgi:hypothetical protein
LIFDLITSFLWFSQADEIFDEEDYSDVEEYTGTDSPDQHNNGWELLPEGTEMEDDSKLKMTEPVHIDDARTVYLVARGGAAGEFYSFSCLSESKN